MDWFLSTFSDPWVLALSCFVVGVAVGLFILRVGD